MTPDIEFRESLVGADQLMVLDLLDRAFGDTIFSENTRTAFFQGYQGTAPLFVVLRVGRQIAGFAIVGRRRIHLANSLVSAITVGPLAIDPTYQNRGLSNHLMQGISELANQLGVAVAYLQGTPNFYHRHGYFPVLPRSKVAIAAGDIKPKHDVRICPLDENHLTDTAAIFQLNADRYSCSSIRSADDWAWLTRNASESFYFYRPRVIEYGAQLIGYFCTDPREPARVREAVHGTRPAEMQLFLAGMRQHAISAGASVVEVMTPAKSPLHEYLKQVGDATYTERIQSNGGQLMRICSLQTLVRELSVGLGKQGFSLDAEATENSVTLRVGLTVGTSGASSVTLSMRHLPGLLSGYLSAGVLEDRTGARQPAMDAFLELLDHQTPFVYQGDNY